MREEAGGIAVGRYPWLINRNFTLLWGGQALSLLGDMVMGPTITVWIAAVLARGQPWAPLAVSGILVSQTVATLVVGPIAGVYVDRWNPRRTMLVTDAIRAALVGGLVALTALGALSGLAQLATVYAVTIAATAAAQFFTPARSSVIKLVVPHDQVGRAGALNQVGVSTALIAGPPLAVPLLFGLGPQWGLALNALSFLASFTMVWLAHVEAPARPSLPGGVRRFLRELAEGASFVVRDPQISVVFGCSAVLALAIGLVPPLAVFFLTRNLHAPVTLYGFIGAAEGVGGLIAAVLAAVIGQRLGLARLYCAGIVVFGLLLLALSRTTDLYLAIVVIVAVGPATAAVNVSMSPLIMRAAPQELMGRVMSLFTPMFTLSLALSAAIGGLLASTLLRDFDATVLGIRFGTIDTIFAGAALAAIATGVYAIYRMRDQVLRGDG
jgi:MFS family permease